MSKYEDSIKCKYCSHFEPGVNRCHLYHDFDQSLDKSGESYFKETSPNNRCVHFDLPAMDVFLRDACITRSDGTTIVNLDDDPQLKQQLQDKESSRSGGNYADSNAISSALGWMILVGFFFALISFAITLSGTGHSFFSAIFLDFGELLWGAVKGFLLGAVCTLVIALCINHRRK